MAGSEVSGRWLYCSLWEVGGKTSPPSRFILWYCSTVVGWSASTVYRLPSTDRDGNKSQDQGDDAINQASNN